MEVQMTIDKELLDILVCPACKGILELTEKEDGLICYSCQLKYPIIDGIPVMMTDEAVRLDSGEKKPDTE
jgi:uncharacterized protein